MRYALVTAALVVLLALITDVRRPAAQLLQIRHGHRRRSHPPSRHQPPRHQSTRARKPGRLRTEALRRIRNTRSFVCLQIGDSSPKRADTIGSATS